MIENTVAMSEPIVNITLTKGPSVTIAVLELMEDESKVPISTISGESRRHPRDQENRNIGDMYALGRAFRTLSDSMIEWADDAVERASKAQTAGSIIHDLLKNYLDD